MRVYEDNRKTYSYEIEVVKDGLKRIGVTSEGLPKFVYLGENAIIRRTTKYILATEDYYLQEVEKLAQNASNIAFGTFNVKTSVNMAGEQIYIDGEYLYAGSETFTDFPLKQIYRPPDPIESYSIQDGIIGFSIQGDMFYMEDSKGKTITYTETSNIDPTGGVIAGTISGTFPNVNRQITSVSKSNGREINDKVYYDWSYTEVTW